MNQDRREADGPLSPEQAARTERIMLWLSGPAIGIALIAFAVIGNGGPGFSILAVVGGAAFMFGAPLLQLAFLRARSFKGRYRDACGFSLLIVFVGLIVPVFLGAFSFW